ncbi:MAG: hypothetical protein IJK52_11745, partial [Oscillospiraceae bacterium]|nr:hypothetical protein [Oscillospiraceae bacterium]
IQALLLFVQAVKQFSFHFRSFLCFFFALYHIISQSNRHKYYFCASPKAIRGLIASKTRRFYPGWI